MNTKAKAKIGEVLLILGTCLFVGGAIGYRTGQLLVEQISGIGALALIFVGNGWGNAYRSCAFAGTYKLPDQISKQGEDQYHDSVKEGEKDEKRYK